MRKYTWYFLLPALLLLNSCNWNALRVVKFQPGTEVPVKTSLTFEFNKDIAPSDKTDQWLDDEFIKFSPKIDGKFKWTSMRELVFSPEGSLQPCQEYVAQISDKVLFGAKMKTDFDDVNFHTPYFKVDSLNFYWTGIPKSNYKVTVQANIRFNYPVVPSQLASYLEVYKDNQRLQRYDILTHDISNMVTLNFGEATQTDVAQKFVIKIKKGFNSIYKKKPIENDTEFKVTLAPVTKLAIQYVTSGYEGDQGWIEVGTSQMVDQDFLNKFVTTAPQVPLKFTVTPSSFRMEGNFKAGDMVDLKIAQGLPGLFGGTLGQAYENTVSMANLDPSISFDDNTGHYMMLSGHKNLSVTAVNISEADVEVYEVFQNNLLFFLNRPDYYQYGDDYGEEDEDGDAGNGPGPVAQTVNMDDYSSSGNDYGTLLYKDKIKIAGHENLVQSFNINLQKALGQKFKGIYVVKISSAADRWRSDTKFISISDLGMICKRSDNDLYVWVNSIATAQPVEGVAVQMISTNNQSLMTATTDASGLAHFTDVKKSIMDFKPRLLMAVKDADMNYLDLRDAGVETSRFDVGGKEESPTGYNAFIYAERNLFRPGEDMHLSAILRTSDIKVVKDEPVIIKILAPNGKSIQEWKKTTNEEGSFEWLFNIPQYAQTGEYNAEIFNGSQQLIGSYKFSVEEFAPDIMRVDLKPGPQKLRPGDDLAVNIASSYLFGAPAAKSKYEMDIYFSNTPFVSSKYPDFDFGNYSTNDTHQDNYVTDGYLDDKGNAKAVYNVPKNLRSGGIITADALVSVFDETGRAVNRSQEFSIYPKNYFIGIKSSGDYFSNGQDIPISIAAVDANQKPINGFDVQAELIRYEWQTVMVRNYADHYSYSSQKKEITEWSKSFTINGILNLPVRPMQGGEYELRIHKAGDSDYVRKVFYAYGWEDNSASSFQVDKEGNVDMKPDKTVYQPGETAKILFSTPFSGKMLVTLERNKIYHYEYVDVVNNTAQLEVPLDESYMPNIFVSATLFKKHMDDQETPFLVAHGWLNLKIDRPSDKINVQIIAAKKIKPRTTQEITIKTIPQRNVFVTLAAVDEGVLQINDYKTPDPYSFMYASRQLSTRSYDLYKFLLPEIAGGASSTGGDEAFEANKKRSIPLTAQRFKLLSYWSGIRRSDADGNVKISLPVPQFNGDIRLMAVAYTGQKFGSAEAHIKVSDDVILLPSVPRFLSANDKLTIPVTVMNTTNRSGQVTVKMKISGPLQAESELYQTINLKAMETKQVSFALKTGSQVGVGKLSFMASGMANSEEDMELAVRPISPFSQDAGGGIIKGGQTISLTMPHDYMNGTQNYTLTVARFPALQHAKYLKELLGYPYGCIEQTVAKAFPQLYFDDLAQAIAPDLYKKGNPVYVVKEAIRKIESMQLYDGSLSYWPGGVYSNWWGSIFAAHFLLEARNMGYEVNENKLDRLLDYIHKKATEKGTYQYAYYNNGLIEVRKMAFKENIYTLYVLAIAGRADVSLMNYYRARPDIVTEDMQYMLAGAYALNKDWASYYALLPKNFSPADPERDGEYFDSEIRANAIMLDVLLDVDANNAQIPYLVKYLLKNTDKFYSTQDLCWGFMALGKAAKANSVSNITVNINASSKNLATYSDKPATVSNNYLGTKNVTLTASGSGQVYYFWSSEGVNLSKPVKETDENLKVRRTYYDRFGTKISNNTFVQGQIVVCKVSLEGGIRGVENVAVTDMIPAGFEIMNPRTTTLNQLTWIPTSNLMTPQYIDMRDDRLLLFTDAPARSSQDYYYMMRVINTGEFQLPAIGAEAMYDPEYHSANGATVVKVLKDEKRPL